MIQNPDQSKKNSDTNDLKNYPLPPLPFARHIKETPQKKGVKASSHLTLDEAFEMTQNMRKMQAELERKLDELYEKTGWTPNYIKTFLDNPGNFNTSQKDTILKTRESLMNSLHLSKTTQEELKKRFSARGTKSSKVRRSKGGKDRHNWISMK